MSSKRTSRPEPDRTVAHPMIGRAHAVDELTDALTNGPTLAIVEGDPGIGKTRLIRETLTALDRAADRPVRSLTIAFPALPDPFPLSAVVDAIRRRRPDIAGLGLSPLAGALRPLYPEWTDQLPPSPEPLDDPKAIRHRVFRALSELIERLELTALVVEDAHWADTATLEWLIMRAAEPPVDRAPSIIVTYRPWDLPDDSLLPRLTTRPPRGMNRTRITLEPLDVAETRRLVASRYSHSDVSEPFAAFLHDATDGVPLMIEEYLLLLEDRDDIFNDRGTWMRRALPELAMPPTVRDSILERTRRLDDVTRCVLESASIFTGPVDADMITAVARLGDDDVRHGLSTAFASGLLREEPTGRFAFRHSLDAQAIRDSVPPFVRRARHERAARALTDRPHTPASELAHHFREAGDVDRWCRYAEAAAETALAAGDARSAVETLLNVAVSADLPTGRAVSLARRLGGAAFFGGAALGETAAAVVEVLRDVLASHGIDRSECGELRLMLGRMLWEVGERRDAYQQWEAAIPDLHDRPDLAIRAMSNLALPLVPDWPVERHRLWLDRAAELVGRVSIEDRRAFEDMRMSVLLLFGEQEGWAALDRLSSSTDADPQDVVSGLVAAIWAAMAWGRLDRAREHLDTVAELIDAPESRYVHKSQAARDRLDWYVGEWTGLHDRVARLSEDEDADAMSALHARQVRALLALARTGAAARRELMSVAAEHAHVGVTEPDGVAVQAALARLFLVEGSTDDARRVAQPVIDTIIHKGVWLWATDIAPVYVDVLVAEGAVEEARDFTESFGRAVVDGGRPGPAAALAVCRAVVAGIADGPVRAAELIADAARRWARMPRPYDESLCLERRGVWLLAAGDREAASTVLGEAERRLRTVGARWDADRIARRGREQGLTFVRVWTGGRRGYGDRLSPRELDVVRLLVQGSANREIAERLFLSTRTVEGHVRSAMRKLRAGSRTRLAVAAMEAGLLLDHDGAGPSA